MRLCERQARLRHRRQGQHWRWQHRHQQHWQQQLWQCERCGRVLSLGEEAALGSRLPFCRCITSPCLLGVQPLRHRSMGPGVLGVQDCRAPAAAACLCLTLLLPCSPLQGNNGDNNAGDNNVGNGHPAKVRRPLRSLCMGEVRLRAACMHAGVHPPAPVGSTCP